MSSLVREFVTKIILASPSMRDLYASYIDANMKWKLAASPYFENEYFRVFAKGGYEIHSPDGMIRHKEGEYIILYGEHRDHTKATIYTSWDDVIEWFVVHFQDTPPETMKRHLARAYA